MKRITFYAYNFPRTRPYRNMNRNYLADVAFIPFFSKISISKKCNVF